MASHLRSCVRGVGSALPARVVTNAELAAKIDTSDEWIRQRTGITQRYVAGEGETTSTLATRAAEAALGHAGLEAGGHRPDRCRDLDARLHLSRDGDPGPGQSRHHRGRGLRSSGGVQRFRLRRDDRRQVPPLRLAQAGAGDRGRDLLPHPRLERPRDLRAVRRRGGRDRARGAGKRRGLRLARGRSPPG